MRSNRTPLAMVFGVAAFASLLGVFPPSVLVLAAASAVAILVDWAIASLVRGLNRVSGHCRRSQGQAG